MDKVLLTYVSYMSDFTGVNWDSFMDMMVEKGFTEKHVNEQNERLGEYLTDYLS